MHAAAQKSFDGTRTSSTAKRREKRAAMFWKQNNTLAQKGTEQTLWWECPALSLSVPLCTLLITSKQHMQPPTPAVDVNISQKCFSQVSGVSL
jgi:hypothetical protein